MSDVVFTIAELTAQEGKLERLEDILRTLAEATRKEPGAAEYLFVLDQSKPNTIVSYEKWNSADDEAAHWKTPHLREALEQFKDVLASPPVVHKGPQII